MAMAYGVNAQAVGKVVLHGAKYGAGEVCGALLGRWDGAEDGPVLVEDAVPFFHKCENKYSPLMEVALAQAESYASTVGLKVVGFYQANERNDDGSLHASTKRIGDAVRDKSGFPKACLLLLNNEGFTSFLSGEAADSLPFTLYVKRGAGSSWEASRRESLKCLGGLSIKVIREIVMDKVAQGKQKDLYDFSEHICDLSKDWRNVNLIV